MIIHCIIFAAPGFRYHNINLFLLILYFLHTPLHELAFNSLNYPLCLFPHNSTMHLYILIKFMLLYILCILYLLKNLQAKIATYAYYRTHFR